MFMFMIASLTLYFLINTLPHFSVCSSCISGCFSTVNIIIVQVPPILAVLTDNWVVTGNATDQDYMGVSTDFLTP